MKFHPKNMKSQIILDVPPPNFCAAPSVLDKLWRPWVLSNSNLLKVEPDQRYPSYAHLFLFLFLQISLFIYINLGLKMVISWNEPILALLEKKIDKQIYKKQPQLNLGIADHAQL